MTPQGPWGRWWSTEEHFSSPRSNGFRVLPVYRALSLASVPISHCVWPICAISCELECRGVERDRICMALRPPVYEFLVFSLCVQSQTAEGAYRVNPRKTTLWAPWVNVVIHVINISHKKYIWIFQHGTFGTCAGIFTVFHNLPINPVESRQLAKRLLVHNRHGALWPHSPKVSVWIGILAKRCPCAWFSTWPDLRRTERCRIYNTLAALSLCSFAQACWDIGCRDYWHIDGFRWGTREAQWALPSRSHCDEIKHSPAWASGQSVGTGSGVHRGNVWPAKPHHSVAEEAL